MSIWLQCKLTDRHESIANLINDFEEEYDVRVDWDSYLDHFARGGGETESVLFIEIEGWNGIPVEDIEVGSTTILQLCHAICYHEGGWDDPW